MNSMLVYTLWFNLILGKSCFPLFLCIIIIITLAVVKIVGHVFSLKLVLYGTKQDPLKNNSHVNIKAKKVAEFTSSEINKRRRGQY